MLLKYNSVVNTTLSAGVMSVAKRDIDNKFELVQDKDKLIVGKNNVKRVNGTGGSVNNINVSDIESRIINVSNPPNY